MIRSLSYLVAGALLVGGAAGGGRAAAQQPGQQVTRAPAPGADTLRPLLETYALVGRLGPVLGPSIWPGFRPDTIPALFWVSGRGFLLLGWRGALPEGFAPVAGGAAGWRGADARGVANTGTSLQGRGVAQVGASGSERSGELAALIAHEAFHVFENATGLAGGARRENTMLLSDYPVFDAANEGDVALEGLVLAEALRAPSVAGARSAAEQFLAVREARQRRLEPELVGFEEGTELNEGRAQYAQVRTLQAAGGRGAVEDIASRLDSLPQPSRSIRTRFYATGAGQALLLDRLAGPGWQARLAEWGGTMQEALASAIGYRAQEQARRRAAREALGGARLDAEAQARVRELGARRRALADSLLARPGVLLVLAGDSIGRIGLCGFDPQNLLAAGDGTYLHTRWLRPCGTGLEGDLNAPTVEQRPRATMRVVIGPEDSVRVTIAGAPAALKQGEVRVAADVRLESPGASLHVQRALLERRGRELLLTPLRP